MSQPTVDAKHVVRALDALTTQVKRIADAQATPVVSGTCDATNPGVFGGALLGPCVQRPQHSGWHEDERGARWWAPDCLPTTPDDAPTTGTNGATTGGYPDEPYPDADPACRVMETRTCPPSYNGPCGDRPCARFESDDPGPWLDFGAAPAADEDAQRTTRQDSINMLLECLTAPGRGGLTGPEADALRRHVKVEMREADTALAKAGDLAETYKLERRRGDALAEERNQAWAERREWEETAHRHAKHWRQAEAAVERVRRECAAIERDMFGAEDDGMRTAMVRVLAALDGTEQPTTRCVPGPYDDCPNCPHETDQPTKEQP